jgi:TRAP-type uncharacterized transport system fused permease subunit
MRTAAAASILAGAGFIVPFMFVYGPELLMVGSFLEIGVATLSATMGVIALAAGGVGYARKRLAPWERLLALVGALLMVYPGILTDGVGLVAVIIVFFRSEAQQTEAR